MKTSHFLPALIFGTLVYGQAAAKLSEADELMRDLASFTDARPLPELEAGQKVRAQFSISKGKDLLIYRKTEIPEFAKESLASANMMKLAEPANKTVSMQLEEPDNINYLSISTVSHGLGVTEIKWSDEDGIQKRVMFHGSLEYLPESVFVNDGEREHYLSVFNWGDGFFGEIKSISEYPRSMRFVLRAGLAAPRGAFVQVDAEDGKFSPITSAETNAVDALVAYYSVHEAELAKQHAENVARGERYAEAKRVYDEMPKTYEIRIWKTPTE